LRFSGKRPAKNVTVKKPLSLSVAFGDHDPTRPRGDFRNVFNYISEIVDQADTLL
jgi:hypothetical protein